MITFVRRTAPPSRVTVWASGSMPSIARVTMISAPSRRAWRIALAASSSPDTPKGNPV